MAYISVSDAVARTGKGQTTIYRLCRKHEHTNHVKREDKKFLIDENFLAEHYAEAGNGQGEATEESGPARQELVDMFIQELLDEKRYYQQLLDRKDEQLARKDTVIFNLQERHRELMNLLEHYSELLEMARQPAPAPSPKPEPAPEPQRLQREDLKIYKEKEDKPQSFIYEARTIYAVLAAVLFLLSLAIVFVDQIRG